MSIMSLLWIPLSMLLWIMSMVVLFILKHAAKE